MSEISYHYGKTELRTIQAARFNTSVRIECYELKNVVKIEEGTQSIVLRLDDNEMKVLQFALNKWNPSKELK